jgi:hypothetical protein
MFRKFIPLLKPIHNKRVFSSCNNYCKVDELTNNLIRQEEHFQNIHRNIGILSLMSFFNIMVSIIC